MIRIIGFVVQEKIIAKIKNIINLAKIIYLTLFKCLFGYKTNSPSVQISE